MSKNIISYLKERGFVDAITSEELENLCHKPIKVYVGFDPTADSLHLGNMIGIMALAHFQRFGHTPVVILGGLTARIGDPSGKSQERPLLDFSTIHNNVQAIKEHFTRILDFSGRLPMPILLNNQDWFEGFFIADFLRDIGKHFRIGSMLAKESVKARIQSEEGMSFTEFSYQLIQAYDFYHLFSNYGVVLQMGGSDQWGNITAGTELIRKITNKSGYGLTWPLLTRSDGKKFGKTEQGAVWLSDKKYSAYQFYQYFFGVPDADVIRLMKMLTFMELEEIEEIQVSMGRPGYIPNTAQERLASEMTWIVHKEQGLEKALKATKAASFGKEEKLEAAALEEVASDMPNISLPLEEVVEALYVDLAVRSGLVISKGEASRLIKNNGAYLNNNKIINATYKIKDADLIEGRFLLISAGKKKRILIKVKN